MWYEKACEIAGRYFHWIPGEILGDDFEEWKRFTGLNVRREDAGALAKGAALASVIPIVFFTGSLYAFGYSGLTSLYLAIVLPPVVLLYLRDYPKNYAAVYRVKVAGAMPEIISNMALSLKVNPNLENALGYAAWRTKGPIGEELRKLAWGLCMREHISADKALEKFAKDWKAWNEDFSSSTHYLRGSMLEEDEDKRISMIDKGVDVALNGASKRMLDYASSLEMPTIALYFLGILLPLILIALLPTLSYVGVSIGYTGIVLVYCVALPLLVYLWTRRILDKRPVVNTAPEIPEDHPGFPPARRAFFMGRALPVSFIPLLGIGLAVPGLFDFGWRVPLLGNSILVLWGIALGLSTYLWATTKHKAKLRNEIRKIEEDFVEALHHLENRIAESRPLEDALAYVGDLMADKNIGKLLTELSLTPIAEHKPLRSMLSGREGPLRFVHSDLIRNCLEILVESSRRSNEAAAAILSRITAHLSNLRRVDAKIKEKLESTVGTMQATMIYFAPFIAGVVVILQDLMNKQLAKGKHAMGMASLNPGSFQSHFSLDLTRSPGLAGLLQGTAEPISMGILQLILGAYILEMIAILTFYLEEIMNGDDMIAKRMALSTNLATGMIIFTASMVLSKFFLNMVA